MYGVELYAAVRLAVVDEGLSHHEAGRRFGIDRRTVKKMLSYPAPPGYRLKQFPPLARRLRVGGGERPLEERPRRTVNGGAKMPHARRPGGPVAAGAKMRHLWSLVCFGEGRGMYGVELYAAVRLAVVDEGLSHHEGGAAVRHRPPDCEEDAELCGAAGVSAGRSRYGGRSWTGSPASSTRSWRRTRIPDVPRKQRHTAHRIFERLRDEHGFSGGYTIVKDYVRSRRQSTREAFVPLHHPPGHAQVDFGEAVVELRGCREKVAFFCLILPHSNVWFVKAYPRETTEAFLDGHVSAFAFLGGIPRSILYDNTTLAVARILGDGTRRRTQAFSHLQSHYLFRDRFGRPGKGNDKGKVEALVKTARRKFMVPIPKLPRPRYSERAADGALPGAPRCAGGRRAGGGAAGRPGKALRTLPASSLRGLRAHARPGLVDGPGALPAGGLLGADDARPPRRSWSRAMSIGSR